MKFHPRKDPLDAPGNSPDSRKMARQAVRDRLLILDIDATLLHAAERPLVHRADFQVGSYYIYLRPNLRTFLREITPYYLPAIWTLLATSYTREIMPYLNPEKLKLEFTWCRERCSLQREREKGGYIYTRDLTKVKKQGYDLRKTLILSHAPIRPAQNHNNTLYISPYLGNPQDQELLYLLAYLKSLPNKKNFQDLDKRNWRGAGMKAERRHHSPTSWRKNREDRVLD